jgi:hypothetical protein
VGERLGAFLPVHSLFLKEMLATFHGPNGGFGALRETARPWAP